MDLYGSGASISQANAQTQAAREINQATQDFNNSLAEQLDQSNLEQDEDRSGKLQKNILSGSTAGGKLALIGKTTIGKTARTFGGFKELPITREETLAREAGAERAPFESIAERTATGDLRLGEEVERGEEYTAEAKLAEQDAAKASEVAGSAGVKTSAEAIGDFAKTAGKVGRVGVAGLGGGIDAFQDIGRLMEGKTGWDTFGSNNYARGGNIANIVGSSLELAGVATGGITPWSLALEGTGALIGLGGSIAEGFGEEKAGEESKQTEQQDITSEARSQTVAQNVEQAVGRTQ